MKWRLAKKAGRRLIAVLALFSVSACEGQIGDGGLAPDAAQASQAALSGTRRLSRWEYDNTLAALLLDESRSASAKLPEDVNDPFDNDYTTQKPASAPLIDSLETLASEAAARAVARPEVRQQIVPCNPTGPSDAVCLRAFVEGFGRRALRRPLGDDEVQRYLALQKFAVEKGDFWIAVELILTAMLQNVEFVHRIEIGEPVAGVDNVFRLNDFELAGRLSYFLWGTTPDDALLDIAQSKGLSSKDARREVAASMLADARARARVHRFHAAWLGYRQLGVSQTLVQAFHKESEALIEKVVFDDKLDYLDLFRSKETFIDGALATHYGLSYSGPAQGAWVSYAGTERQGILSHGSVLASFSKFEDTSPTQRGIFIRTRLLCGTVDPPPPNINADEPPPGSATDCKSQKYLAHRSGGCAGCHNQIDPLGDGLEQYDREGKFRVTEPDRPDCAISGQGQIAEFGSFQGPSGLSDLLVSSGALEACVVKQVYRFAVGRRETEDDTPNLDRLASMFAEGGHKFDALLLGIAASDAFGYRKGEE